MCYMNRVGIRELRQNLTVYLRRVQRGETLEVTDRGRPVAVIGPLEAASSALDRNVQMGRVSTRGISRTVPRSGRHPLDRRQRRPHLRARREMSVAYVDASAIVKLIVPEAESEALVSSLRNYDDHVTSVIAQAGGAPSSAPHRAGP